MKLYEAASQAQQHFHICALLESKFQDSK